MFFGEYKHSLDEKSRLRVPAKLKKDLGKTFVFTKGTNGCLFIFPENIFQKQVIDKLSGVSLFDKKGRDAIRLLMSSAHQIKTDNQGRILLPKALKAFANINKELVFVGVGTHIELWGSEKWDDYLTTQKDNFDDVLSGLADYGI